MLGSKQRGTVIAKGLKIVGSVTAEGLVEVNGQIDGVASLHLPGYRPRGSCHRNRCRRARGCGREGRRSDSGRRGISEVTGTCRWRYSPPIYFHRKWCLLRWSFGADSGKRANA